MAQQQRSHVPKFGSWDSDNVPYTAYFESARKEKGTGLKMNPNDPEDNPEAFMVGSNKSMSVEKQHAEGRNKQHNGHWRNTSDHQNGGNQRSMTSESGSNDKSSSDYSLQQQSHRQTRSARKKSLSEVNNFVPSSPGPGTRLRSANNPSEDMSSRSASVPKFGAWDEKDPTSGEGFTVIFNKVKEEKQIAAAKFPAVPPQPSYQTSSQKKHTRSKKCCCLF